MTEISDICIHKDIINAKRVINEIFGCNNNYTELIPIEHCKQCYGKEVKCFYYYPLNKIKRQESEENGFR